MADVDKAVEEALEHDARVPGHQKRGESDGSSFLGKPLDGSRSLSQIEDSIAQATKGLALRFALLSDRAAKKALAVVDADGSIDDALKWTDIATDALEASRQADVLGDRAIVRKEE